MKFEIHPGLLMVLLVLGGVAFLFFHYGTLDRCSMMRQEVRMRFPDREVPAEVRESPGGHLVVGMVEGGVSRFLTYDLSENACMVRTARMWFADDTEIGAILLEE